MVIALKFSPPVGYTLFTQVQYPYTFVVTTSGGNVTATDNTGTVSFSGSDAGAVIQSIHNSGTGPLSIYLTPGVYPFATKVSITKNNISLIGAGAGVTTLASNSGNVGDFSILDIEGGVSGSAQPLTVNTAKGDTSVTMLSGNALTFSGITYALLLSELVKDTELSTKAGEIQKIQSISGGIVNFRDQVSDTYLTADSGRLIGLNMLQGINLSNMSIKSNAASGGNSQGFVFFRFCQGVGINAIEVSNCFWGGVQLSSCINANVNASYMHDVNDITPSTGNTLRYGLVVHAASKNVVVNSCQFTNTRHSVTMGGQTGTNFNGVVRNVTVTNCTSETSDTAHYDTHQACEGIVFSSNTAYGGIGASGNPGVYGFQIRSPRTQIIGNTILETKTRGIYIFGQASNTVITGNQIDRVIQASGTGGQGILLESGITACVITNNRVSNIDGRFIDSNGGNTNIIVDGNILINNDKADSNANIYGGGNNWNVCNNMFISGSNRPLQLQSGCNSWIITNNDFSTMSNPAPALSGAGHIIYNNTGFQGPVSGNVASTIAGTSGAFTPAGFFFMQLSGGTFKVPYMNS